MSSPGRMGTKIGVGVMSALLLLYIGFMLYRAVALLASNELIAGLMALGILILSLIAIWGLVRELKFGFDANRLTRILDEKDKLFNDEDLPAGWDGTPSRDDALRVLPRYEEAAAAAPESWAAWQRLGIIRRNAGKYGEARAAIRTAIRLERQSGG